MKVSVFVCTYNEPRQLDFVLAGLSRQRRRPDEVFIGDDGSGPETRDVVEEWQSRLDFALHYLWQADVGYRKARIMNEAVRRSTGEHLIFLDGDSFPHPDWVGDHAAAADGERILAGRRVKLGPEVSKRLTREMILAGRLDNPLGRLLLPSRLRGDTKRLSLGLRLPQPVARAFHPRPRKLMGVNFSMPRGAFYEVNGFNEDWDIYGHEDRDIELRLQRAGRSFYPLLNRGIVYHVFHVERPRTAESERLIRAQEASDATRCERGLVGSMPFDPET